MLFDQDCAQSGLLGVQKPLRRFLGALERVAPGFVVTSTTGGEHQAGSCHYTGCAADLRGTTYHGKVLGLELLRSVARAVERELVAKAGSFDIVPTTNGAFHVEWDPK